MQVAVKPFTIGSLLAIAAAIVGFLICLGVIPSSSLVVGIAIILLALAFFV